MKKICNVLTDTELVEFILVLADEERSPGINLVMQYFTPILESAKDLEEAKEMVLELQSLAKVSSSQGEDQSWD